ncbi:MAG TPA: 2Fe-2S iron-sulfur cluster-binding protein [Stellaceae bacterium]|nr:2Fe-2S iron-sulfur cluster-binding protein [Stellaceae bacterium]
MRPLRLTINGMPVTAMVEPRTSLADFLRDQQFLTGTHIGCEHGVCGACTLLIDDAPARSCITLAVACEGRTVRTIEGLEDDPVAIRLRAAFKAEHGLQCGYCTPGMLVTARDIVRRLPDADAERVRLELAGNLCRCTGYAGIVRAIRRVLAEPAAEPRPAEAPLLPELVTITPPTPEEAPLRTIAPPPSGAGLRQIIIVALPLTKVWPALRDPRLIAGCVPGVSLDAGSTADRVSGRMVAALGPIRAQFTGSASVRYEDAMHSGSITGEGRDSATGTRLRTKADFSASEPSPGKTAIELAVDYVLQGPLAQFGRGAVVEAFASELGRQVAANLEARLTGSMSPIASEPLRAGSLLWRVILSWLRRLFGRG